MTTSIFRRSLVPAFLAVATALGAAACAGDAASVPSGPRTPALSASLATRNLDDATTLSDSELADFATIRRVTARYHRIEDAKADGFVLLHGCEVRTEEGPVGTVYVNFQRVLDGRIDPELPDGLIYEPVAPDSLRLVAAEFAVLIDPATSAQTPTFHGVQFQREDEFGVFGLHVWVWRDNPNGVFAETNPTISCTPQ